MTRRHHFRTLYRLQPGDGRRRLKCPIETDSAVDIWLKIMGTWRSTDAASSPARRMGEIAAHPGTRQLVTGHDAQRHAEIALSSGPPKISLSAG